jgi:two-component system cell cycle sensor histidine kinase/response regulator CckA
MFPWGKNNKDLSESEEKLRLIIDTSPIGICTVDQRGNFVTTNSAYELMLGYSKEELSKLSFYDITHPADRPQNKNLFLEMFSLESPGFKMEKRYIKKDGETIAVSVHATAVNGNGSIRFGTAFVEDITEHKKNTIRLQQAKRMEAMSVMAGGIAHNFNNILTVIIGCTQYAKEITTDPVVIEELNQVLIASGNAVKLVKQILSFSSQDDDVIPFPHSVNPVAEDKV